MYSTVLIRVRITPVSVRRPSAPGYIAFVLDETLITDELISEIADALLKSEKRFMRIAFVGEDRLSSKKLNKLLQGHGFAIKFFEGIEPAKEWLMDERGEK